MKRSTPLKRKALLRKTRLRQVGARKKAEARDLAAFRKAVEARAIGCCEVRRPAQGGFVADVYTANSGCPWHWWYVTGQRGNPPSMHAHHILPRSRGGTHDPENGLHVCASCHRWIHEHPKEARERGWTR